MAQDLSPAKCTLLAIHYASEGNIKALQSYTSLRAADLNPELVLRILLTYLPESIDPDEYTKYVSDVCAEPRLDSRDQNGEVDVSPVKDLSEHQARRRVKRLKLVDVRPSTYPLDAPEDILTQFLCHRAYRIDAESGLLNLLPQLIQPFVGRNEYLRTWYIGVVLPLVRLELEYYPENENRSMSISEFEELRGRESVEFLMSNATHTGHPEQSEVARDIKGLVGPWIYGSTARKRRKLDHGHGLRREHSDIHEVDSGVENTTLSGVVEDDEIDQDWKHMYHWMAHQARKNFPLVTRAVENWDGPEDVDIGDFTTGQSDEYSDKVTRVRLKDRYAQAIYASCYAVESDTRDTILETHTMLTRLARLLDFDSVLDLETDDGHLSEPLPLMARDYAPRGVPQRSFNTEPATLLEPGHPLTTPRLETFVLLHMIIRSAFQLSTFSLPISIMDVARLRSCASTEEQLAFLVKVLRLLASSGTRRDESVWNIDRAKLLWLWNWGVEPEDDVASSGFGILGRVSRKQFEEEFLKCLIETSCYDLAIKLYLSSTSGLLSHERVEHIVLSKAMEAYDSASNGNRTRGGMKKANDIISTFRAYFPQSIGFRQAAALISATHALSFYSLTLQHGVPFQPVSIRVSQDPIGLIDKVLEQNSSSYTQLDDLISIAQNLVSAGLPQRKVSIDISEDVEQLHERQQNAEKRVTRMAIEAALHEDDFETAYSYIVSRLTPSSADIEAPGPEIAEHQRHERNISNSSGRSKTGEANDDISWRTAFLAGRYRPASASSPSLRRLEQRTELLSLALLLGPVSALSEILAAWRRCEEETTALQMSQHQAEEEMDDRADKRQSLDAIPGNFTVQEEQPALVYNQKRREMGRMAGTAGADEAPVSMFDLTRSAAQAISKNAFPLRGAARDSSNLDSAGMESSVDSLGSEGGTEGQQRARKRDMVASAVSGGLASGLGWMLGATPVSQQHPEGDDY